MDTSKEQLTKDSLYTGLKVLYKYLIIYKKSIVLLSILGVLSAVGNGFVPYLAGKFLDSILSPEKISLLNFILPVSISILLFWTLLQIIVAIVDWRINLTSEYLSNTVWLDYMSNGFGYLLNLPASFHKTNKIGEIGNKINAAASALEIITGRIIIDLAPPLLSILIALVVSFTINVNMTIIMIIGLIIYIIVLLKKVKPLSGYQKDYYDTLSKAYGISYDAVGNALAIKQSSAELYEQKNISTRMKSAVPLWMRLMSVWSSLSLYQRLIILFVQLGIFSLSIIYVNNGSMTLGELLAFNGYSAMIFGPFVVIARNWQSIQNGIVTIQETEKIMLTETEIYEPSGGVEIDVKGDISFKNVYFGYDPEKPILQDINLDIKSGQIIALVGESGVGKSTLIDLLSAYHFADRGTITIDGQDIRKINLRGLRRQIAVVPQEVVLFNDKIKMNIIYGNFNATDEEVEEAARKAHALEFIEKFASKWDQEVGERGVKLSVGQKQRIAIARAILRKPKILILDEPTSALDAGSEKIISNSLEELMKGKTTFIIAHRLITVRKADNILVFKEGKIIENGRHEELIKIEGGEYKRLYDLQIGLS